MRKTQDQQSINKQALVQSDDRKNRKNYMHIQSKKIMQKTMQNKIEKIRHKFHAQGALSSLSLLLHFYAKYKKIC
jgi:CYTH domain-containing protein